MLEQLTLIEAGQALGISPDAVRMRIKRGSMQAEKQRKALLLCEYQGVTQEQAAVKLGIGQRSVSDRLTGAHKKIRKYLRG